MAGGCRRGSPNIGISQCGAVQFAKPKIVPSTVAYFESASGLIRPVPILENRASTDAVADRAVVCRRNRFHPFSRAPLLLFKCSHTRGANGCAMAAMRGRVLVAGLSAPFPSRHSFSTFSHNLRHLERDGPCGSAPKSPGELIPLPHWARGTTRCTTLVPTTSVRPILSVIATRRSVTPAHPPKSAEKLAREPGTWFDMYSGRAAMQSGLPQQRCEPGKALGTHTVDGCG